MEIANTKEMPIEGQFVATWIYNGMLWSDTYKWNGKQLYIYSDKNGLFNPTIVLDEPWCDMVVDGHVQFSVII